MTSVITGDIINSRSTATAQEFLTPVREVLSSFGNEGRDWDIFRGDSFQVEIQNAEDAFWKAVYIKAALKSQKNLDARMAIGIGDKSYDNANISESSGTAFYRSGSSFEKLKKEKTNLLIKTAEPEIDQEINTYFQLALLPMDLWTTNSAELVKTLIENPELTQTEIGKKIGIKQNTVSERRKRAAWDQLKNFDSVFRKKIEQL